MSKFFPGWRRKVGVLTLKLAIPFLGLALASYFLTNDVLFSINATTEYSVYLTTLDIRVIRLGPLDEYGQIPGVWIDGTWTIPYWSLVLPLTAISAFLLLSKSRNSEVKSASFGCRQS